MYVKTIQKSIGMICLTLCCSVFSNFVTSRQFVYEKWENQSLWSFMGRPRKLLIRHSSSNSDPLGLLCHVIVANMEHHLLLTCRSAGICRAVSQCSSQLLQRRVVLDLNRQSSLHGDFIEGKEDT